MQQGACVPSAHQAHLIGGEDDGLGRGYSFGGGSSCTGLLYSSSLGNVSNSSLGTSLQDIPTTFAGTFGGHGEGEMHSRTHMQRVFSTASASNAHTITVSVCLFDHKHTCALVRMQSRAVHIVKACHSQTQFVWKVGCMLIRIAMLAPSTSQMQVRLLCP